MMNPHRYHLVAAAVLLAASASAQSPTHSNARWQPWYGCWAVVPPEGAPVPQQQRAVCMTPTSNPDVVDIVALVRDSVVRRDTIDATGRTTAIAVDGCKGTQHAQWSEDGRRVFLNSTADCDGAVTTTNALVAMTPFGEWIDVRSVTSAGRSVVHVARYHDIGLPFGVPLSVVQAIRSYGMTIDAARLSTNVPIPASAVIEAAKYMDTGVLNTWVAQKGQTFVTDATSLRELADAGVPGEVTDAMVTEQANSRDVYGNWSALPPGRQASDAWDQGTGMRVWFTTGSLDPWGYGLGLWRYGRDYTRYAFGTNEWGWVSDMFGYPYVNGVRRSSVGYVYPPTIVLKDNTGQGSTTKKSDDPDPRPPVETPPPKAPKKP